MDADHHAVFCAHWLLAVISDDIGRAFLRGRRERQRRAQRCEEDGSGEAIQGLHGFGQDNPTGNECIGN